MTQDATTLLAFRRTLVDIINQRRGRAGTLLVIGMIIWCIVMITPLVVFAETTPKPMWPIITTVIATILVISFGIWTGSDDTAYVTLLNKTDFMLRTSFDVEACNQKTIEFELELEELQKHKKCFNYI